MAFGVFVFLIPFETLLSQYLPSFSLSKMAGWVFFFVVLLTPRFLFFNPNRATQLFLAYLAVYALLAFAGPYGLAHAALRLATLFQMVILFHICTRLLQDNRAVKALLWTLWAASASVSILQLAGFTGTRYYGTERLSVLGEDPNTAAAVFAIGITCGLGLVLGGSLRWRRWTGVLVVVSMPFLVWAIVQTDSRGGVLALASGAVVFALAQSSARRKAGGVLLVVLIFATLLGFSERSEMVTTRWERTLEAGDTSERWEIQLEAAQLFLERPFLGWGPSNNYDELGMRLGETGARGTHNQMLALLTQVGLLGTVPYAMALLLCLRGALRAVKGRLGPAPLALVTVVAVVSLSLDWQNRKLYWLVLALALASQVSSLQGMSGSTAAAFRRRRRRLLTPLPGEPN